MGTICDVEWREVALSAKDRAVARDSFVREFDRQFRTWSDIAKVAFEGKRDEDWKILGHSSWRSWILASAPASHSYIYLTVGLYEGLSPDFSDEELTKVPLGTARVIEGKLKSPDVRRDPRVRELATKKPSEFVTEVNKIRPEQHLEDVVEKTLKFSASQWLVLEGAWEGYKERQNDETATFENFVEWLVLEVCLKA
jgi:hypothetical protein